MSLNASSKFITITCKGNNACDGVSVNAITEGFTLICEGDNNQNCANLNLNISAANTDAALVNINCGQSLNTDTTESDASCIDSNIYCGANTRCEISCPQEEGPPYSCSNINMYCASQATCMATEDSNLVNIQTASQTPNPTPSPSLQRYVLMLDKLQPSTELTWYEAEASCMELFGTHLASIATETDWTLAKNVATVNQVQEAVWIGLNRFLENGEEWQWFDGTKCNGSCNDLSFLEPLINTANLGGDRGQNFDECGYLSETGDIDSFNCNLVDENINGYMCNGVPSVDYICVYREGIWEFVMEYYNVYEYQYSDDDGVYKLKWDDVNYGWTLFQTNDTIAGSCEANTFLFPYECDNWQFLNSNHAVEFLSCPC